MMKKLVTALLAGAMAVSMAVPSFAASTTMGNGNYLYAYATGSNGNGTGKAQADLKMSPLSASIDLKTGSTFLAGGTEKSITSGTQVVARYSWSSATAAKAQYYVCTATGNKATTGQRYSVTDRVATK